MVVMVLVWRRQSQLSWELIRDWGSTWLWEHPVEGCLATLLLVIETRRLLEGSAEVRGLVRSGKVKSQVQVRQWREVFTKFLLSGLRVPWEVLPSRFPVPLKSEPRTTGQLDIRVPVYVSSPWLLSEKGLSFPPTTGYPSRVGKTHREPSRPKVFRPIGQTDGTGNLGDDKPMVRVSKLSVNNSGKDTARDTIHDTYTESSPTVRSLFLSVFLFTHVSS